VGSKGRCAGNELGPKGIDSQVQEHIDFVDSIQGRKPYINQANRIAESTLTCIMARESAYSGMTITWDQIMNSKQELAPKEFGYEVRIDTPPLAVPGDYKFV
jgi:hypothetical protein